VSWFDWVVLVGYFLAMLLLGIWIARRIGNADDFFMPRTFGKTLLTFHTFGSGTHSDQAVAVAAKTYVSGVSGIWYQWLWLFVTPFYWIVGMILRRTRAVTMAQLIEVRYNRSVAYLYTGVALVNTMVAMGLMLKGSGAVIVGATGGMFSETSITWIMTALFVTYGILGGLAAAIFTDFFQSLLTVVFSFLLLPFVLSAVGGIGGMREAISDPKMFSLVVPGDIGIFYVLMMVVNALMMTMGLPSSLTTAGAGRTEMDARFAKVAGSLLKRVCTIAWTLTGLAAVALYLGQEVNPDEVYGQMAREFLPLAAPGLVGLFVAALLASVMSSCDMFMISASALFTRNLYQHWAPNRSDRHYLLVGRLSSFLVVAGGVYLAFWFENVVHGLEIFFKVTPMMGVIIWLGIFWRPMTARGAWAAALTGFACWWATEQPLVVNTLGSMNPGMLTADGEDLKLPWQILIYLAGAFLAGIVGSLSLGRGTPKDLEPFFALIRTPVAPGEVLTEPCKLPESTPPRPRNNIAPFLGLEIPRPSRVTVIGFLVAWVAVAVLIASFVWIIRV